ncbi:MAG: transcription elongation factor GreA [Deinococcus sp.]|nr:transcription elongation factor GreA [Deinococcus sp.]
MSEKKPVFLTAEGKKKLQDELNHLKTVKIEQIAEEMGRAISEGDLRENAGYDEARRAMWHNNSRISELEDILARAVEVASGNGVPTAVTLGVKVALDAAGKRMDITIVGSHEADMFKGRISDESPMGRALLGRKVGDVVELKNTKATQVYKVLNLEYA